MAEQRSARFNFVMQPSERFMLAELAEADGVNESDVLRQLVRKSYGERFGDKKPKKLKQYSTTK